MKLNINKHYITISIMKKELAILRDEIYKALYIPQIVEWLNNILTKIFKQ